MGRPAGCLLEEEPAPARLDDTGQDDLPPLLYIMLIIGIYWFSMHEYRRLLSRDSHYVV